MTLYNLISYDDLGDDIVRELGSSVIRANRQTLPNGLTKYSLNTVDNPTDLSLNRNVVSNNPSKLPGKSSTKTIEEPYPGFNERVAEIRQYPIQFISERRDLNSDLLVKIIEAYFDLKYPGLIHHITIEIYSDHVKYIPRYESGEQVTFDISCIDLINRDLNRNGKLDHLFGWSFLTLDPLVHLIVNEKMGITSSVLNNYNVWNMAGVYLIGSERQDTPYDGTPLSLHSEGSKRHIGYLIEPSVVFDVEQTILRLKSNGWFVMSRSSSLNRTREMSEVLADLFGLDYRDINTSEGTWTFGKCSSQKFTFNQMNLEAWFKDAMINIMMDRPIIATINYSGLNDTVEKEFDRITTSSSFFGETELEDVILRNDLNYSGSMPDIFKAKEIFKTRIYYLLCLSWRDLIKENRWVKMYPEFLSVDDSGNVSFPIFSINDYKFMKKSLKNNVRNFDQIKIFEPQYTTQDRKRELIVARAKLSEFNPIVVWFNENGYLAYLKPAKEKVFEEVKDEDRSDFFDKMFSYYNICLEKRQLSSDILGLATTIYDPVTHNCYRPDDPDGPDVSRIPRLKFQVDYMDYILRGFFDMGPYKGLAIPSRIDTYPVSPIETNVNTNTELNDSLTTVSGGGYIIATVSGDYGNDPEFVDMMTKLWNGGFFMTSWGGYLIYERDIIVENSLKMGVIDSLISKVQKNVSWKDMFEIISGA